MQLVMPQQMRIDILLELLDVRIYYHKHIIIILVVCVAKYQH